MEPEDLFYELMWRIEGRGRRLPLPWWVQQYFRDWKDAFDEGLFPSRAASFASNALYRYWNMVGVKDRRQECLIGQAGEVEPVYDEYALGFFLFDPVARRAAYPQYPDFTRGSAPLTQSWENGYLPILTTLWDSPLGHRVEQTVFAATAGPEQKDAVLVRYRVRTDAAAGPVWLVLTVTPAGPTGFRRQDKARQSVGDRRLSWLRYRPDERQVEVNRAWGPIFDSAPLQFGVYGNGGPPDPDFYLRHNPYEDLLSQGALNGWDTATDFLGGYCQGGFAWAVGPGGSDPPDGLGDLPGDAGGQGTEARHHDRRLGTVGVTVDIVTAAAPGARVDNGKVSVA